jgi:hypothetical protein
MRTRIYLRRPWARQTEPDFSCNVAPHAFIPLRRFFNRGRCRACFAHESAHPVGWRTARPMGNTMAPEQHLPQPTTKGQS